ncbi:MAG: hypothetical protein WBL68_05055 [Nitrososphaeraceae archaeon]
MYQAIPSLLRNSSKLTEAEITSVIIGVDENEAISMRRKSNVNDRILSYLHQIPWFVFIMNDFKTIYEICIK